jgi:hypothetical protein
MTAKLMFCWFDFWIGAYWDREARALYLCPVPMVVVKIAAKEPPRERSHG